MNFPELSSIKTKRQHIGVKQNELALKAGVSQSLIAKIESLKLIPSYDIAKKIFLALEILEHGKEKTCKDVMTKHFIGIPSTKKAKEAIDLMKKHDISQIPVFEGKRPVGSISESGLYSRLTEGFSKEKLFSTQIKELIEEPFPIINADTPLSVASPLLKAASAILLIEKNQVIGIITKSNLF